MHLGIICLFINRTAFPAVRRNIPPPPASGEFSFNALTTVLDAAPTGTRPLQSPSAYGVLAHRTISGYPDSNVLLVIHCTTVFGLDNHYNTRKKRCDLYEVF
jgi:hypothetical protein